MVHNDRPLRIREHIDGRHDFQSIPSKPVEASMPDEKIEQKRPKHADDEPNKAAQIVMDDTVDDSFPASDPPAWTTTAHRSIAARRCKEGEEGCEEPKANVGQAAPASSRAS
jgi:hypothetical protein